MTKLEQILQVDGTIYSLTAIKKAIYKLAKHHSIVLFKQEQGQILLRCQAETPMALETLTDSFYRELIDQDLREIVAKETDGLRQIILAQAFAPISLLVPESHVADYQEDPLNIHQLKGEPSSD